MKFFMVVTWSSTKELKPSNGKKIGFSTNGAGSTVGEQAEEWESMHSDLLELR